MGLVRRKGPQFVRPRITPPELRIRVPVCRAISLTSGMEPVRTLRLNDGLVIEGFPKIFRVVEGDNVGLCFAVLLLGGGGGGFDVVMMCKRQN